MKITGTRAAAAARILGWGGILVFAVCLILTAFENQIPGYSGEARSSAGDDCDTPLRMR
jgi:hypothetical protein